MPGLRVTFAEACRLWQVDAATCHLVLHTLLQEQFLTHTKDGAYVAVSGLI
jgi:DNA-binding IclR family transcriptional regulator